MTQNSTAEGFRLHCDECEGTHGRVGDFDISPSQIVHIEPLTRTIVFYATCPEGHRTYVDSEFVVFNPGVQASIDVLRGELLALSSRQ